MKCRARQYSDQMVCDACGLVWDMNDPDPPSCRTQPVTTFTADEVLSKLREWIGVDGSLYQEIEPMIHQLASHSNIDLEQFRPAVALWKSTARALWPKGYKLPGMFPTQAKWIKEREDEANRLLALIDESKDSAEVDSKSVNALAVEVVADRLSYALSMHDQARTTLRSLASSVKDEVRVLRRLIDDAGKEKNGEK